MDIRDSFVFNLFYINKFFCFAKGLNQLDTITQNNASKSIEFLSCDFFNMVLLFHNEIHACPYF
eukprot:snap_masked-scaffold_9-processed-gene-11.39-mRNA-1 protein AED:1.00 eAED:1.00 QI:0/0/0/0/1/1/2/0/63